MLLSTGLILNWLIRSDQRSELGIRFSGIGLGIAGSAAAVALMGGWRPDWREQWLAFATIGGLLAPESALPLRAESTSTNSHSAPDSVNTRPIRPKKVRTANHAKRNTSNTSAPYVNHLALGLKSSVKYGRFELEPLSKRWAALYEAAVGCAESLLPP